MGRPQPVEAISPQKQTLQAWEDMRIEILHELQEGACADVPDALIDEIGKLVVMLESFGAEMQSIAQAVHLNPVSQSRDRN